MCAGSPNPKVVHGITFIPDKSAGYDMARGQRADCGLPCSGHCRLGDI